MFFIFILYIYLIFLIQYNESTITPRSYFYKATSLVYYDKLLLFRTRLISNENESFSETTYSIFELDKKWDTKINMLDNMTNKTWKLPDRMVPTTFLPLESTERLLAYVQIDKDTWSEENFSDSHIYSLDFNTGVWKSEEFSSYYVPTFKDIKRKSIKLNRTDIKQARNSVVGASFLSLNVNQFGSHGTFFFGGLNFIDGFKSPYLTRYTHIADYSYPRNYPLKYSNLIPPSAFQTATQIDNRIIILGGIKYQNYEKIQEDYISVKISKSGTLENTTVSNLETVYIFDVDEGSWSIQKTKNFSNKPRIGHTATYVPKLRSIFVYGGTASLNSNDTVYNDLQVLNIDTWEWSNPTLSFEDQTPIEQGRAWHTSQLIQDKILYFYGDIRTNDNSKRDILVLDLKEVQLSTNSYQFINTFGPFNNLTHISRYSGIFAPIPSSSYTPSYYSSSGSDSALVMGITFGIAGGIVLAFLAFFLIWRFRSLGNKQDLSKNDSRLSLLLPDTLTPRFTDTEHVLNPFKQNQINTNQTTWDLDSNYAYSINEPDIREIMNSQPNSSFRMYLNFKNKKTPTSSTSTSTSTPVSHKDDTLVLARRWSSEFGVSPKLVREIPPTEYLSGSTMLLEGNNNITHPLLNRIVSEKR